MIHLLLLCLVASKRILFTRHGARSPASYSEKDQELWGSFKPGYLTKKGYDQIKDIGKRYQKEGLMQNENCVYEQIHFQGSTTPRCIVSTIAFIQGLCPKNYVQILNHLFEDFYHQYSGNETEFQKLIAYNFHHLSSINLEHFYRQGDFMFHGHSSVVCPALYSFNQQIYSSEEYQKKTQKYRSRNEFQEVFTLLQQANPDKLYLAENVTLSQIAGLFDHYQCNQFEGLQFPNPSFEAQLYMREIFTYKFYEVHNQKHIQHISGVSAIFQWIKQELHEQNELSWYSGHDSNQVALMAVILYEELIPPFGSQMMLNIDDGMVNVYFNEQRMRSRFCKLGINCSIKDVVKYLDKYIAHNLSEMCGSLQDDLYFNL